MMPGPEANPTDDRSAARLAMLLDSRHSKYSSAPVSSAAEPGGAREGPHVHTQDGAARCMQPCMSNAFGVCAEARHQ